MGNKNIIIIGAGGLAKEVKYLIDDINQQEQQWNLLGFVDSWGRKKGTIIVDDKAVIGTIEELNATREEVYAVIAIGTPDKLKDAAIKIANQNIIFPNLIHPSAVVSKDIKLGFGNIITFANFISCNVEIGNFNFFNTKCAIGHDTKIGNYNVFNPNTQISGNVTIGNENLWGLNSSIVQGKGIGNHNTIGAYSFVIRNLKDNGSYFGIPATRQDFI
jgi:sugar O-acyltransferase (sialic acid O-acetyltransferase NeuD family)